MMLQSNFSFRSGRSLYYSCFNFCNFRTIAVVFHVYGFWTSTRGGVKLMWTHVDRGKGVKNFDFLVDVING